MVLSVYNTVRFTDFMCIPTGAGASSRSSVGPEDSQLGSGSGRETGYLGELLHRPAFRPELFHIQHMFSWHRERLESRELLDQHAGLPLWLHGQYAWILELVKVTWFTYFNCDVKSFCLIKLLMTFSLDQEMKYDLDDVLKWEYMLCSPRRSSSLSPDATEENKEQNDVHIARFPAF